MALVSRKGILAIAAVIDVAMNARARPVSAKALAARHRLPPRHLEPVLQGLVRDGILKGFEGPTAVMSLDGSVTALRRTTFCAQQLPWTRSTRSRLALRW